MDAGTGELTGQREGRASASGLGASIWVFVTLAAVACALTLLFLGMRSVMEIGGMCAEGGPFEIRQRCPEGVPGVMIGSIWGGLLLAFVYGGQVVKRGIPGFGGLLWPALFLSLGWNFLEFGLDPPGAGGVAWTWLVCAAVFALVGGLPLLAVAPGVAAGFLGRTPPRSSRRAARPLEAARRTVAEAARRRTASGADLVSQLERLEALRVSGALDEDEYREAKRRILGGEEGR